MAKCTLVAIRIVIRFHELFKVQYVLCYHRLSLTRRLLNDERLKCFTQCSVHTFILFTCYAALGTVRLRINKLLANRGREVGAD